jgi:hypothetical protein
VPLASGVEEVDEVEVWSGVEPISSSIAGFVPGVVVDPTSGIELQDPGMAVKAAVGGELPSKS